MMAAACVLDGPQDGRFDVRYAVVGECIRRVRPDVRTEDVEGIAATAVDCGTWSEGEDVSYRLANISGCLENALPRG